MKIIEFNKKNIVNYLNEKNIDIRNIDEIFSKMKIEIGEKRSSPYACIDKDDSYKMIISEDIPEEERYKWLNHEMIHVISNNQPTVNEINVGGIIVEDKEKDIWIGQYLNEAITEYINQQIIKDKYSDYYDRYLEALDCILKIVGEDIVLKSYFTNNLNMLVNNLLKKTGKTKTEILEYINRIDYLYDNDEYNAKLL